MSIISYAFCTHENMLISLLPTSHAIQEAFWDAVDYFLRISIRPFAFHCCLGICIRELHCAFLKILRNGTAHDNIFNT